MTYGTTSLHRNEQSRGNGRLAEYLRTSGFFALLCLSTLILNDAHSQVSNHAAAISYSYTFTLRDVVTGIAVAKAEIWGQKVKNLAPDSLQFFGNSNDSGKLTLTFPPGQYAFEIKAEGYRKTRSQLVFGPGMLPGEILLSPTKARKDLVEAEAAVRSGYTSVYGFTVDASTHNPLPGVRISFADAGVTTKSNRDGFFSISFASPRVPPSDEPSLETVTAKKFGYKSRIARGLAVYENSGAELKLENWNPVKGRRSTLSLSKDGAQGLVKSRRKASCQSIQFLHLS